MTFKGIPFSHLNLLGYFIRKPKILFGIFIYGKKEKEMNYFKFVFQL